MRRHTVFVLKLCCVEQLLFELFHILSFSKNIFWKGVAVSGEISEVSLKDTR